MGEICQFWCSHEPACGDAKMTETEPCIVTCLSGPSRDWLTAWATCLKLTRPPKLTCPSRAEVGCAYCVGDEITLNDYSCKKMIEHNECFYDFTYRLMLPSRSALVDFRGEQVTLGGRVNLRKLNRPFKFTCAPLAAVLLRLGPGGALRS